MRAAKLDLLKKLRGLLIDSPKKGIPAKELANALAIPISRIYGLVRQLKEGYGQNRPLGIHPLKDGYILSEYATRNQDVELLRKLNGIRVSIAVTANSAAPWIKPRWNSIQDKRDFAIVMRPVLAPTTLFKQSMKILVGKTKEAKPNRLQ